MRTTSALLMACFAALLLTACGADAGGTATSADVAGTWVVDTAALKQSFMASEAVKNIPEDERGTVLKAVAASNYAMVLNADGTWTAEGTIAGMPNEESGTWKLEGKNLSVTQTHESEQALDKPVVRSGVFENGEIRVSADGDADAPMMRLTRKK